MTGYYDTPLGPARIEAGERGITALYFAVARGEEDPGPLTDRAAAQLLEYLQGRRRVFTLPLSPRGTDFQNRVWSALLGIPYGQVQSYKWAAGRAGNEKACRAAGMACNRNPIPIFIPCHRVLGANGGLTGYAFGLPVKERLLALERGEISAF